MATSTQLKFVQQKIAEARTGIFTQQGDAYHKLRSAVINVLRTETDGSIWFVVQRPAFHKNKFDLQFPAEIHFHDKASGFHLSVQGNASISDDVDLIYALIAETQLGAYELSNQFLAIKLSIRSANYFEAASRNWKKSIYGAVSGLSSIFSSAAQRRIFTF